MAGRIVSAPEPVTVTFDGTEITASDGEPLVATLVAAGHLAFARSPKFHRPRGPACMRAACDGCLARVDGSPNVMTCMIAAREGMTVESQNTLGPRDLDLLRMTDWFFPQGMNHHELFAGVPGVQQVMQAFARRVAGLGKLPYVSEGSRVDARIRRPVRRRVLDAVIVGSGPSGIAVAAELVARGREVEIVDDALAPGGSLVALGVDDFAGAPSFRPLFEPLVSKGLRVRTSTVVASVYGTDLLVAGPEGAEVLEARDVVFATGAHDGVLPFEGNDVPGVLSARAALFLLAAGVTIGDRIVVVVPEGGGPFGDAYATAVQKLAPHVHVTRLEGEPLRVRGTSSARDVSVRIAGAAEGAKPAKFSADAVIVDAPRSPAYELPSQCGAELEHRPSGFRAKTDGGKIRDGFWAVGEVVGTPFDPTVILEEARDVARRIGS